MIKAGASLLLGIMLCLSAGACRESAVGGGDGGDDFGGPAGTPLHTTQLTAPSAPPLSQVLIGAAPQRTGEGPLSGPARPRSAIDFIRELAADGSALKLSIDREGLYRLSRLELAEAGFDVTADPRSFQVFTGGEEAAILVSGEEDRSFDEDDAVIFYGRPLATEYTRYRTYWLRHSVETGRRILRVSRPPAGDTAPHFLSHARAEEDRVFVASLSLPPGADHWFSRNLIAYPGSAHSTWESTVKLEGLAPQTPATLSFRAHSLNEGSCLAGDPDHHLSIMVNGLGAYEGAWCGRREAVDSVEVPPEILVGGENALTVESSAGGGVSASKIFIDFVEVSYRRHFAASSDRLIFADPRCEGREPSCVWPLEDYPAISVSGFSTSELLALEVTDPLSPQLIPDAVITPEGNGGFSLTLGAGPAGARYLVAAPAGMLGLPFASGTIEGSTFTGASMGDDGVTYTALIQASDGDPITLTHIDPRSPDSLLAVSVEGHDIVVGLATDEDGLIASTAAEVVAEVNAHGEASQLVQAAAEGDGGDMVAPNFDATIRDLWRGRAHATLLGGAVLNRPSDLRNPDHGADYLIVTHRRLLEPMTDLADHRSSKGLVVETVTIDEVYDEFSAGNSEPQALRDFLIFAAERWHPAPTFVLLAGDGTFDPNYHRPDQGGPSLLPAYFTDMGLSYSANDNFFADLDGDEVPDIFLGRLPVETAEEAGAVVDKIIIYEDFVLAGEWEEEVVLAADLPDETCDYGALSDDLLPLLDGYTVTRLYATAGSAAAVHDALLERLDQGTLWVNFLGHGSFSDWGFGQLLDGDDVAGLQNGYRLPVVVAVNCLNGSFYFPFWPSLSELFLLNPFGGAVAFISTSSLEFMGPEHRLMMELHRAVFEDGFTRLGEALAVAKAGMAAQGDYGNTLKAWLLIGDPALTLRTP